MLSVFALLSNGPAGSVRKAGSGVCSLVFLERLVPGGRDDVLSLRCRILRATVDMRPNTKLRQGAWESAMPVR